MKFFKRYEKLIYLAILFLAFIVITYIVKNYFMPFFIIIIMIFLCSPIYKIFCSIIKSKKAAAIFSIFIVNIIIFFLIFYLGRFIFSNINDFIKNDYINYLNFINGLLDKIHVRNISNNISNYFSKLIDGDFLTKKVAYTADSIFTYFIGNMAAYFILYDKEKMFYFIKKMLPSVDFDKFKKRLLSFNKIIKIEIMLVLVTTIETIFGLWALGIKNPIVIGIICGILDILPVVGTGLAFLPMILYQIMHRNFIIAAGLVLLYILLQVIRQILETNFISSNLKVHPLLILISVYIGAKIFGIIGVFIGPIYIATAKEIIFNE